MIKLFSTAKLYLSREKILTFTDSLIFNREVSKFLVDYKVIQKNYQINDENNN